MKLHEGIAKCIALVKTNKARVAVQDSPFEILADAPPPSIGALVDHLEPFAAYKDVLVVFWTRGFIVTGLGSEIHNKNSEPFFRAVADEITSLAGRHPATDIIAAKGLIQPSRKWHADSFSSDKPLLSAMWSSRFPTEFKDGDDVHVPPEGSLYMADLRVVHTCPVYEGLRWFVRTDFRES